MGDPSKNWMAIVSLVVGIISFCLGGSVSIILPIIGLVLGFMGRASAQSTMAVIGIILNILSLLGGIVFWLLNGFAIIAAMTGSM